MATRLFGILLTIAGVAALGAADIEGTIVIKHKLTKRKVTVSAGEYDRGMGVELGAEPVEDPLAYERTHVVIYIEGSLSPDITTATMEQKNRRFVPDLLVISRGSAVSFPNLDPIFHNVFSLSKPKSFDLGSYSRGQSRTVRFDKAGVVLVNCYLHSNMTAVIVVTPNHWNTRADAAGRFVLRDVPPGRQTLVAWHKAAGFFRQVLVMGETDRTGVEFVIPIDENGVALSSVAKR